MYIEAALLGALVALCGAVVAAFVSLLVKLELAALPLFVAAMLSGLLGGRRHYRRVLKRADAAVRLLIAP